MKHHESEDIYGEMLDHNRSLSKGNSTTFKRSRFDNPSLSIGKSSIKKIGNAEITLPTTNYMISLAKYWMLLILNHLTDGHEPSDYIFYIYRREINPEIFRQNFAYQQYFFNKRYRSQYKKELFFTYHENINRKNRSPMIMEIGFEFYFLLKKMEENIKLDYDERYTKNIIKLLPKWDKPQIRTSSNVFFETINFFIDLFRALMACFCGNSENIVYSDIKKMSQSDFVIRGILNFYENHSAQIEILKDNKLQEFWFPRLPFCVFNNNDVKDEFTEHVNRTDSKTK